MVHAGIALVLAGTSLAAGANVLWPPPALQAQPGGSMGFWSQWRPAGMPQAVWDMALGILLTLLSQLLLAARLVSEELLLKTTALHPLQVRLPAEDAASRESGRQVDVVQQGLSTQANLQAPIPTGSFICNEGLPHFVPLVAHHDGCKLAPALMSAPQWLLPGAGHFLGAPIPID